MSMWKMQTIGDEHLDHLLGAERADEVRDFGSFRLLEGESYIFLVEFPLNFN